MTRPSDVMHRVAIVAMVVAMVAAAACAPLERHEGLTRPAGVFEDRGPATATDRVRAMFALRARDREGLQERVRTVSTPGSPRFRQHTAREELAARFYPRESDALAVQTWAKRFGMETRAVAHNRLFVWVEGTVAQLDEALSTTLHSFHHAGRDDVVYGTPGGVTLPHEIADIVSLDVALGEEQYASRGDGDVPDPPSRLGFTPDHIASAYRFDPLFEAGQRGRGATLGVVVAGDVDEASTRAFWRAFGIVRSDARIERLAPPREVALEATMDVEWAGALAPEAELVVYAAPDVTTTSLLFAFNEAIARGDADVVTYSYSRHESSEPEPVRRAFDLAAELGAAAGVSVIAASGDTAKPDVPASSPHVTAVAGTRLEIAPDGTLREDAWTRSGSGDASHARPAWQNAVVRSDKRAIADVALNAGASYLTFYRGRWTTAGGTSLAAPLFAAMLAVIDGARRTRGESPVGFVNPALYLDARVQRAFRDVTESGTGAHLAGPGWDYPTGWGAPLAAELAERL